MLNGKKTYIVAITSVLTAVIGLAGSAFPELGNATGYIIELPQAIQMILAALGGASLRHGIAKN